MKIPKVVQRFDEACKDMAFKGSYHPDDWAGVENEYEAARKALVEELARLNRNTRRLRRIQR